jgi:hypothetical protein
MCALHDFKLVWAKRYGVRSPFSMPSQMRRLKVDAAYISKCEATNREGSRT